MKQQTKTFKIKVNDKNPPSSVYLDSLKNSPDQVNRRINFGADGPSENNLAQHDQKPTFTSPRNVNNLYMPNKLGSSQSMASLHYPKVKSLKELNEYQQQQSSTTISNRGVALNSTKSKHNAKSKKENNVVGVKGLPSIYISAKVPQKASNQTSSRASLLIEEQTELKQIWQSISTQNLVLSPKKYMRATESFAKGHR